MKDILSLKTIFSMTAIFGILALGFLALRSKDITIKGGFKRETRVGGETSMELKSNAFEDNTAIPQKYTCDGENMSPPLAISHVPEQARSLALIMHDPDAPVAGGWTHWILFNMDPSTVLITENSFPMESVQAQTSFGKPGYGGPCPPSGTHHYEFKLYALDTRLPLDKKATKADIEHAMEGHVLSQAVLTGLYRRAQ